MHHYNKGSSTSSDFIQVLRNGERTCIRNEDYAPGIDQGQVDDWYKIVGWATHDKCTCAAQKGFYTQYKSLSKVALSNGEVTNSFWGAQFDSNYEADTSLAEYVKNMIEGGTLGRAVQVDISLTLC